MKGIIRTLVIVGSLLNLAYAGECNISIEPSIIDYGDITRAVLNGKKQITKDTTLNVICSTEKFRSINLWFEPKVLHKDIDIDIDISVKDLTVDGEKKDRVYMSSSFSSYEKKQFPALLIPFQKITERYGLHSSLSATLAVTLKLPEEVINGADVIDINNEYLFLLTELLL